MIAGTRCILQHTLRTRIRTSADAAAALLVCTISSASLLYHAAARALYLNLAAARDMVCMAVCVNCLGQLQAQFVNHLQIPLDLATYDSISTTSYIK